MTITEPCDGRLEDPTMVVTRRERAMVLQGYFRAERYRAATAPRPGWMPSQLRGPAAQARSRSGSRVGRSAATRVRRGGAGIVIVNYPTER